MSDPQATIVRTSAYFYKDQVGRDNVVLSKEVYEKLLHRVELPEHKLKRNEYQAKEINFYGDSFAQRIKELDGNKGFEPTTLSEFAAGYSEAINNVRIYGLERVSANAVSGIPK